YNAQVFFDQREGLLRSVAGSSVRNTDRMPAEPTPDTFAETRQISVAPLPNPVDSSECAPILTPRDRADVAAANARIVYAPAEEAAAQRLRLETRRRAAPISHSTERWLSETLAMRDPVPGPDGRAPIVWLRPPMDDVDRFFL